MRCFNLFYKKKIIDGKVVKTVDLHRCGLLVVYSENLKLDTIILSGNCMLMEQIDSLTILDKKENSVDIYFKQLIKDNVRYSDTVDFVHYFDQEVSP